MCSLRRWGEADPSRETWHSAFSLGSKKKGDTCLKMMEWNGLRAMQTMCDALVSLLFVTT